MEEGMDLELLRVVVRELARRGLPTAGHEEDYERIVRAIIDLDETGLLDVLIPDEVEGMWYDLGVTMWMDMSLGGPVPRVSHGVEDVFGADRSEPAPGRAWVNSAALLKTLEELNDVDHRIWRPFLFSDHIDALEANSEILIYMDPDDAVLHSPSWESGITIIRQPTWISWRQSYAEPSELDVLLAVAEFTNWTSPRVVLGALQDMADDTGTDESLNFDETFWQNALDNYGFDKPTAAMYLKKSIIERGTKP